MVEEKKEEYKNEMIVLKTANELSLSQLRINKEPKEHLQKIIDGLLEALETDRMSKDEEFYNFVCKKVTDLLPKMSKEISTDDSVSKLRLLPCCLSLPNRGCSFLVSRGVRRAP